jgi:PEP-CTERM motif
MDEPMKNFLHIDALRALAAGALLAAAPAMAGMITFDTQAPLALAGGDTLAEAGFTLTALDNPWGLANGVSGLSGMILDGADAAACEGIACPAGNASRYYAGLNDGALRLSRDDGRAFSVTGLDFAFLAAQPVDPDLRGQLVLTGTRADGGSATLALELPGPDAAGNFGFAAATLDGWTNAAFTTVTFSACVFIEGDCVNSLDEPAFNLAQFALDNIDATVSAVPEPSTYAMLLAGLAGLGVAARRPRVA